MTSILRASTALVALGLTSVAADAQDRKPAEKPISLTMGGFFRAYGIVGWQDDNNAYAANGSTIRDHGIGRESEIHFRGETALDNGLRVGVHVELEGETSADQIDDSFIYLQHANYGRVHLGERWGANILTHKGVVGHPIGYLTHFGTNQLLEQRGKLNAAGLSGQLNTFATLDGTSDKIVYDTPRIYGARLALSYTPDDKAVAAGGVVGESGQGLNPKQGGPTHVSEVWTVSVDYVERFGGLGVGLSAAIQSGKVEETGRPYDGGRAFQGDPLAWNIGLELSYAGFRFGGAYKHIEDNVVNAPLTPTGAGTALAAVRGVRVASQPGASSGFFQGDHDQFTIGADYTFGRWTLGGHYGWVRQEVPFVSRESTAGGNGGFTGSDTLNQWSLQAVYYVAPGVQIQAGWTLFDFAGRAGPRQGGFDSADSASNDGHLFHLGTQLIF